MVFPINLDSNSLTRLFGIDILTLFAFRNNLTDDTQDDRGSPRRKKSGLHVTQPSGRVNSDWLGSRWFPRVPDQSLVSTDMKPRQLFFPL